MTDQQIVHSAKPFFTQLTDAATGRRVWVRKAQVVAVHGADDGGTVLLLASGGQIHVTEAHGETGLQFHNGLARLIVNGKPTEGQFSVRTGFISAVEDNGDGTSSIRMVGGHILLSELDYSRWDSILDSTEHPQATPYSYPHWQ